MLYFREEVTGPMRPVAIFADQLTCERTRGIHEASYDGDAPEERFEGLFAAVSDFHEKMNFLQVGEYNDQGLLLALAGLGTYWINVNDHKSFIHYHKDTSKL